MVMSLPDVVFFVSLTIHWMGSAQSDVDPFADSIPFAIKWNGPLDSATAEQLNEDTVVLPMVTKDKQRYRCHFQNDESLSKVKSDAASYSGPTPHEILEEFALSTACSYRVESYWTYELCHGKHLRQYHEEPDPKFDDTKTVISPEYYLGYYKVEQEKESEDKAPTLLLEGIKYPYLTVKYDEGTECDLTNTPRQTTVQYVCYYGGRGDLYQIKETSTCEYTAVILVAELCNHPNYRPIRETSRFISCHSLEGAPEKPKMVLDIDKTLSVRSKTSNSRQTSSVTTTTKAQQEATRTGIGKSEDDIFLQNFLSGEHCLQGGSGWWSYELCYGKTAKQFHIENGRRVTNILLGNWNLVTHLEWLQKFPNKNKRKPNRRFISQFYSGGDFCEETKSTRTVEVKLKCMKTGRSSSHAVAIYLLEPTLCQYILTVESPILCNLVEQADDRGLLL